jgi:ribosome biogenesis GTPase / thiamine phosphate phosphatase
MMSVRNAPDAPKLAKELSDGIVLLAARGAYTVQSGSEILQCTLRGNLKKEFQYSTSASHGRRVTRARRPHSTDAVAVGDRVRFTLGQPGIGVIEEIMPRRTRFCRSGFRGEEQTLVCNLDQVAIVFAVAEPRPDPWKLDRFLVASESENLEPVIVANKADLLDDAQIEETFREWTSLGYRMIITSVRTDRGIDDLRAALKDKVTAFVGPSGAGKSSLLNKIQPGLNLRTGEIGYVTYKGKHTTTASQLIPLISGGWVADTPGLRQLELIEKDRDALIECFPELRSLVGHCRFDDCRHEAEPGCAIKIAVEEGRVSDRRYRSFLTLVGEVEPTRR